MLACGANMDSTLTSDSPAVVRLAEPIVGPELTKRVETEARLTRFDREKIILYVAAIFTVLVVLGVYLFGYLGPAFLHAEAIVSAAKADKQLSAGCYLVFWEHAVRMLSAYSLRFLGMLIGTMIAFMGMLFSIKGLEAAYSLDMRTGGTSASLKTASPGLVLCTLGIVLCGVALLNTSTLTFSTLAACVK
jgi:hypothetical protein